MTEAASVPSPRWLLRLRSAQAAVVAGLVLGARYGLGLPLPMAPLVAILVVWVLTTFGVAVAVRRGRRLVSDDAAFGLLALDAVLLTAVLYLTGGPSNPFNVVYLVHVSLAAVALKPRHSVALAVLSVILFGVLFFDHVPLPMAPGDPDAGPGGEHAGHGGEHAGHGSTGRPDHDMQQHLRGMWIAYVLAAAGIITFVSRLTRELAMRDRDLAEARAEAQTAQRLAGLATLAAGTAHELSTPLSTIAVVAQDLAHDLAAAGASSEAVADAELIREQVARCQGILEQLRAGAGEPGGETPTQITTARLLQTMLDGLASPGRVDLSDTTGGSPLHTYERSLAQALRAVVQNALDASEGRVDVRAARQGDELVLTVTDHGIGMDAATVARVGEPFFTTKSAGRGMGLGVFLARAVVERLGGRLGYDSVVGRGTTATLHLPLLRNTP